MRYLAIVVLALVFMGCPPKSDGDTQEKCTTEQKGFQKCDKTDLLECTTDGVFDVKEDCAKTNKVCVPHATIVGKASCAALAKECKIPMPVGLATDFDGCDTCSGTNATQGSCDDGLLCLNNLGKPACFTECDPTATDSCDTGRWCYEYTTGSGACLDKSATGEVCMCDVETEDCDKSTCAISSDECAIYSYLSDEEKLVGMCSAGGNCSSLEVGSQNGCSGNSECMFWTEGVGYIQPVKCPAGNTNCDGTNGYTCKDLGAPYGKVCQNASGALQKQSCTAANEATVCDMANDYQCLAEFGKYCFWVPAYCAEQIPMWDGSGDAADFEFKCNSKYPNGKGACGVIGATGTPAMVSCNTTDEDTGDGFCLGLCDDPWIDGNELDCGVGYTCDLPTKPIGYIFQMNGTVKVTCDMGAINPNAPCNTTAGYTCKTIDSADVCQKAAKMCLPL